MGMFDYVNVEIRCPKCNAKVTGFQSKDADCVLDTVEAEAVNNLYSSCACGHWVEFSRRRPFSDLRRSEPLDRTAIEAMGFVMHQNES